MTYDLRYKKCNPNAGKRVPATDFTRKVKVAHESVPLVQAPAREEKIRRAETPRKERK